MTVGLGIGADYYINNGTVKQLADANFNTFTTGNAMKHDAVVGNKGELNFATIDAFVNAIPADAKMYGHCFLWHTQQKQMYLKSLIAPEVVIEDIGGDDVCENVITNSGFESGTDGWTGLWGKYTYAVEAPGKDSDKCHSLHHDRRNGCELRLPAFLATRLPFGRRRDVCFLCRYQVRHGYCRAVHRSERIIRRYL